MVRVSVFPFLHFFRFASLYILVLFNARENRIPIAPIGLKKKKKKKKTGEKRKRKNLATSIADTKPLLKNCALRKLDYTFRIILVAPGQALGVFLITLLNYSSI